MQLKDWLLAPYCHDPLHLNRFYRSKTGAVGLDKRDRLPLHEPAARKGGSTEHQKGAPCPTNSATPSRKEDS